MNRKTMDTLIFDKEQLYRETMNAFECVIDIDDLRVIEPIIEQLLSKHLEISIRHNRIRTVDLTQDRFDGLKTQILVTIQQAYLTVCNVRQQSTKPQSETPSKVDTVELTRELLSGQQIDVIARQVADQFHRAFWDKLSSDLEAMPPQLSHLLILLTEVRNRLDQLTPNNQLILNFNKENIDLDYLRSQFNRSDNEWTLFFPVLLSEIIYFLVEDRFQKMIAPVHDKELRDWWLNIQTLMKSERPLYQTVPEVFKGVYKWLELIEDGVVHWRKETHRQP